MEDTAHPTAYAAATTSALGPACVLYTSGSTGEPKGVEIRHEGIINQIQWRRQRFRIDREYRILQTFSMAFDPSLWEIFGTLEAGACIVISQDIFDASRIARCVLNEGVTIMQTVPSMLRQLVERKELALCSPLRHVICGGEVLESDTVRRFYDVLQTAQLHNLYGPTEATIDATCWTCRLDDTGSRVPIGRPIANTRVALLDRDGREVPAGDAGEIHIAGPGVANGYYRNPALSAARFVKCPGGMADGTTFYRTGDLARLNADGALEFLGRMDRQVKIHGCRVEPAEVESVLASHPLVDEVSVVAKTNPTKIPVLVAYVTPATLGEPSAREALLDHAAYVLPPYMVPSVVVPMTGLPRRVSSKVDFTALPEPDWSAVAGRRAGSLTSVTEQRAAAIWHEVLGLESFDPDANFFSSRRRFSCAELVYCTTGKGIWPSG